MVGTILRREFLEDEMLVLRLGAELGGLEQPLAVEVGFGEQVDRPARRKIVSCQQREVGGRLHPAKREGRLPASRPFCT